MTNNTEISVMCDCKGNNLIVGSTLLIRGNYWDIAGFNQNEATLECGNRSMILSQKDINDAGYTMHSLWEAFGK